MMRIRGAGTLAVSAAVGFASLVVRPAVAQRVELASRDAGTARGEFRIAGDAPSSLQDLWRASKDARVERVACLGGRRSGNVAHITRVLVLEAPADSAHVSAVSSLNQCRPPEWFGTVHTHIAQFNGLPFVTFSADDRNVISIWRGRWKADGVFCILYSATDAYCEAGTDFGGDTMYTETRTVAQQQVQGPRSEVRGYR